MRVLHIYSGNLNGGVETLLKTLASQRHLCPEIQPHFALCFEGALADALRASGVPPTVLGSVRISRPWTIVQARKRLTDLLRRERFDLIICHSAWPHMIFAPVVKTAGIPLVFWLHDASDGSHWIDRCAAFTVPDLVICNSQFTNQSFARGFPGISRLVLYYPVSSTPASSSAAIEQMRERFQTASDSVVIVQPSRMEPYKGHKLHLQALSLLKAVPNWTCWIAGAPQRPTEVDYYNSLKEDAHRYAIADRVRFLGWVDDVPALLAASQIHCQPCTGPEPFGLTFVEAMMAARPVVTTALGGALEIISPGSGVLVPPDDAVPLASALRELIQDADLRARIGISARSRANELCDPERQLQSLASALIQAANQAVAS